MSLIIDQVKYPNAYSRMIQQMEKYEKEAKVRMDAKVIIYTAKYWDQEFLKRLVPNGGIR